MIEICSISLDSSPLLCNERRKKHGYWLMHYSFLDFFKYWEFFAVASEGSPAQTMQIFSD